MTAGPTPEVQGPPYCARLLQAACVEELAALFDGQPKRSLAITDEGVDIQRDNDIRAGWAARAVIAYGKHLGSGELTEDLTTVIGDLIGDLLHLLDAVEVEWDDVRERAERFHGQEVTGDL